MSLKGTCPRCRAPLDVAVAVVLADPVVTGRVYAARGTTPTNVVSACAPTAGSDGTTVRTEIGVKPDSAGDDTSAPAGARTEVDDV